MYDTNGNLMTYYSNILTTVTTDVNSAIVKSGMNKRNLLDFIGKIIISLQAIYDNINYYGTS